MKKIRLFLLGLFFLLQAWPAMAAKPVAMPSPIPEHPRLLATKGDWERLRVQIKEDPWSGALFSIIEAQGKKILTQPPSQRVMEGRRLLGTSRTVLERLCVLAMLANLTDDPAYAERAIAEMKAVCDFSDWHPAHFLDVGEMALGIAIGYDWLYDKLTPADREQIEKALLEKGIKPSLAPEIQKNSWIDGANNWTQVCHAGMCAAAIAIADRKAGLATQIMERAVANIPKSAKSYAPDGAYQEGPNYWHYGTSFHVVLAAELQRFCGDAYGLDTLPGFPETPVYLFEIASPTDIYFNYSDSPEFYTFGVPLFWFAHRFGHPELARHELEWLGRRLDDRGDTWWPGERLTPLALLWYYPKDIGESVKLPLQWHARGDNPLSVHRSAFGDTSATFVAIKGGSPSCSHGHMDAGSFVLDADGIRWGVDLGMENYNKLETSGVGLWDGRQEGQRWDVFRLGAESHNLLRFNSGKQTVKATAPFLGFQDNGAEGGASVIDLTALYPGEVSSARRGVRLLPSHAVLFQDEWTAKTAVDVSWQMMTRAQVTVVRPGEIELTQKDQKLTLRILEPANAEVVVEEAWKLTQWYDSYNKEARRITLKTHSAAHAPGTFRVLAVPGSCAGVEPPAPEKLEKWVGK